MKDMLIENPFLRKILERAKTRIMTAGSGLRNATLYNSARLLGGYLSGGADRVISEEQVEKFLFSVSQSSGYTSDDGIDAAKSSIRSGLENGKKSPIPFKGGFIGSSTLPFAKNQRQKDSIVGEPSPLWVQAATRFLEWAQEQIDTPQGIELLKLRHISLETAKRAGLGFNPATKWENRSEWGLPPKEGKNGIFLPRGLVIPTYRKSGLKALRIRRYPEEKGKHLSVEGSGSGYSYVIGNTQEVVCLFESPLDAILAWEVAGGNMTCIATVSASFKLDNQTRDFINGCQFVFGCPDYDKKNDTEEKPKSLDAGQKAWAYWKRLFPNIILANSFMSKDLGDLAKEKGDSSLREWLIQKIVEPIRKALEVNTQEEKLPSASVDASQEGSIPSVSRSQKEDGISLLSASLEGIVEERSVSQGDSCCCWGCDCWEPLYLDFSKPRFWDRERSRLGYCNLWSKAISGEKDCCTQGA